MISSGEAGRSSGLFTYIDSLGISNAARHDRPRPDGRQHRPPADEARSHHGGLRQGSESGRRDRCRRRGRRRRAGGIRRQARQAARRLGHAAGGQDHRVHHRDAGKADAEWRRHHRWRQHVLAGRRPPRQGAAGARHPLCRRRHLRRRLGNRARLLHDDRRRQGGGRPARSDLRRAGAGRRRYPAHRRTRGTRSAGSSRATSTPVRSAPVTSSRWSTTASNMA